MAHTVTGTGSAAQAAAWLAYRDVLQDLSGRAYEEAEPLAWEALQAELGQAGSWDDPIDGVHAT